MNPNGTYQKLDSNYYYTDANAWFRVRYLGSTSGSGGTYVVEEISAPNGYVMDTAPQTAYIFD